MKTIAGARDLDAVQCRSWKGITKAFDSFPRPKLDFDENGEIRERLWIFRGHASSDRLLKPSLERVSDRKSASWAALELMFLAEFQARAPQYVDRRDLPPTTERLAWLALMQHYGVPTRLLDFTYSPYVALYFALRNFRQASASAKANYVNVLAINAQALMERASSRSREADQKEIERKSKIAGGQAVGKVPVSMDPDSFATDRDEVRWRSESSAKLISAALDPEPSQDYLLDKSTAPVP